VGLANLGSESETCVGSRVHLVGVSTSFEKNFYQLPFTPPSLVRRIGPSHMIGAGTLSPGQVWLAVAGYGRLWPGCGRLWPAAAGCGAAEPG
jgi:hypothetical protein